MVKESACNAEVPRSIPGSRRCPGEGNGNPLQYSCLENSMDRGDWQGTVHGVSKSQHTYIWFALCNQKESLFLRAVSRKLIWKRLSTKDSGALVVLVVSASFSTLALHVSLFNLFSLRVYWWQMEPCLLLSKHIFQKTSKCSQPSRTNTENIGLFHGLGGSLQLPQ